MTPPLGLDHRKKVLPCESFTQQFIRKCLFLGLSVKVKGNDTFLLVNSNVSVYLVEQKHVELNGKTLCPLLCVGERLCNQLTWF